MPPIAIVFTAKEHMLLKITIYLFQFLLCLIQVMLAYRRLRNRLRQMQTITHLTSIRIRDLHYRLSNLPSPPHNNNNDHGLYLPNQPRLLCPIIQCRDHLLRIHQEIMDFLHYQSHVRFAATTSIPPGTCSAVEQEREAILEFLREERQQIRLLKSLLDTVDANNQELIHRYEDSPVTQDEDWGTFAWGPLPQWEQLPPPQE
jgi:hypothetical protein